MITVMGATGHTGGAITRLLLDAGEQVRALGRSRDRLAPLAAAGADVRAGDAADPGFLAGAFRGADAVYTLIPFDPAAPDQMADQVRLGRAIAGAVRTAGVPHVVALSSVGADVAGGTGFIAGLHEQEQRLRTLGGDVLVLRPGMFFETFAHVPVLAREHGAHVDGVAPDVPVPMIATRDVAAVAAAALRKRDWTGFVVRELLGPRDLTFTEVSAILGVPYVRLPGDELAAVLRQAGFSERNAALHLQMCRALSEGIIASRQGRTPWTGTPTRFEDWVGELP